jgi:hypothetical protein
MSKRYVFFMPSERPWLRRLKPFGHCGVIQVHGGQWLLMQQTLHHGVEVYLTPSVPEAVILPAPVKQVQPRWPLLPTCVGFVKHVVGINNPFIVTPNQLYKFLQKEWEVEHGWRRREKAKEVG